MAIQADVGKIADLLLLFATCIATTTRWSTRHDQTFGSKQCRMRSEKVSAVSSRFLNAMFGDMYCVWSSHSSLFVGYSLINTARDQHKYGS